MMLVDKCVCGVAPGLVWFVNSGPPNQSGQFLANNVSNFINYRAEPSFKLFTLLEPQRPTSSMRLNKCPCRSLWLALPKENDE